jgi:hypothetical protein
MDTEYDRVSMTRALVTANVDVKSAHDQANHVAELATGGRGIGSADLAGMAMVARAQPLSQRRPTSRDGNNARACEGATKAALCLAPADRVWRSRCRPGNAVRQRELADDLGPIAGTRDPVILARFHIEVSALLISVLKDCNLPAGRYRLAHLDNATMERLALREASGRLPREWIAVMLARLPRLEPDGHFNLTVQHCRLLRKLRLEWPDGFTNSAFVEWNYPDPVVHFKRPFGDMTAFEIDMAEILDLPIPEPYQPDPLLWRLFWEMWPALQTFVEHAVIRRNFHQCRSADGCRTSASVTQRQFAAAHAYRRESGGLLTRLACSLHSRL